MDTHVGIGILQNLNIKVGIQVERRLPKRMPIIATVKEPRFILVLLLKWLQV